MVFLASVFLATVAEVDDGDDEEEDDDAHLESSLETKRKNIFIILIRKKRYLREQMNNESLKRGKTWVSE